ncbi:MAG: class I SAM-dependent methyltransferase [Verrucomicrobia bacterium]|nr:class I SAM-dependent methyltransferase [Verrucomicrobiota bacterium]MBV9656487.1 class I SAM-dependent methyltransferase [Verrucomicrobiota bacterium]
MLSIPAIHEAVLRAAAKITPPVRGAYLDLGSGGGELIALMRERFKVESFACDGTGALMKLPDQKVEIADLNREPLPYEDNKFSLVTCTETIEHLERYRETIREVHRVLRPGGWAIFTTPNILNVKSRLRFLLFGFYNLFGPLAVRESAVHDTGGHINPVGLFYLGHALLDAGFRADSLRISVDRWQRSSLAALIPLWPILRLGAAAAWRKEVGKFHTINAANAPLVRAMNSRDILLGRTLVVAAAKAEV